jgi:hypothetical protein
VKVVIFKIFADLDLTGDLLCTGATLKPNDSFLLEDKRRLLKVGAILAKPSFRNATGVNLYNDFNW